MDKKSRRKQHSRRKRIQLDDDQPRGEAEGEPATSSAAGNGEPNNRRSSRMRRPATETDNDKAEKRPRLSSPPLPLGSPPTSVTRSPTSVIRSPPRSPQTSPPRAGAASPEPNCAICLGKLENKSFTDSCFHQFCYVCLLEWSKVKAECPLCKQTFKSIIHNIRSNEDYDQYHIPRPEDRDPLSDLFAQGGRRFRYRTTVTDHRYYGSQALAAIERWRQESLEQQQLQRPSRRQYPASNHRAWRALRQAASSSFRRGIYVNSLKAKEPTNTRRRFRQTSPDFFRENTACTHRLVPWLNRELNAVLEGREDHVAYVLDLIMGLIKRYNINSEEFYQHVYAFIGRYTRHFMHEFLMFARSPYHMSAYDQHVVYEPSSDFANNESDTETVHHPDDNESDVEIVSTEPPQDEHRTRTIIENAPPRIQPLDTNLLPWESSIISMAQPSYSYFNPVIPAFTPLLSTSPMAVASLPSTSGWESPIPGPSWNFGSTDSSLDVASDIDVLNISDPLNTLASSTATSTLSSTRSTQPLDLSTTATANSAYEDSNNYRTFLDGLNLVPTASGSNHIAMHERTLESTDKHNPVICSDSDSDSDAVMIVDYEKPWLDRSPIHLSTDNSSDCEILITGTSNMGPDKRVKKHKKRDEVLLSETENEIDKSASEGKRRKKRKHRSRSRSIPKQNKPLRHYRKQTDSKSSSEEELSRSHSPLLLRFSIPQYKDKFSKHYRKEKERRKHCSERKHRSESHSSSRPKRQRHKSVSSSSSDGEHVSFRSHKHKSSSGMEIMEYFKKRVKRKKSKKSKHKSTSPCDLTELYHHKKKKKSKDRHSSKDKGHRHKLRHDHFFQKSLGRNSVTVPAEHLNISRVHTSIDTFGPRLDAIVNGVSTLRSKTELREREHRLKRRNDDKSSQEIEEINASATFGVDESKESENVARKDNSAKAKFSGDENILGASNSLEFVEMLPSQVFDKELESLAQLFPDFTDTLDTPDSLKLLTYKKHPHGHKKSSKTATVQSASMESIQTCVVNSSVEKEKSATETEPDSNPGNVNGIRTDDIQLNAVTSCTDPENEVSLANGCVNNASDEMSRNIAPISTDSLINTDIPVAVLEGVHSDSDPVDVEGDSEDSDVDVLKISEENFPVVSDVPFHNSGMLENAFDNNGSRSSNAVNVDVGNVSDSNTDITVTGDDDKHLDVECLSDSGSDTVKYAGFELVENQIETDEREIDITGVSDSETITYLSETNNVDNDSDIDVLDVANEDIIIEAENSLPLAVEKTLHKEKSSKTLCLDSDSEGIDLDYQCEHSEEIDILSELNTEADKVTVTAECFKQVPETIVDKVSSALRPSEPDKLPVPDEPQEPVSVPMDQSYPDSVPAFSHTTNVEFLNDSMNENLEPPMEKPRNQECYDDNDIRTSLDNKETDPEDNSEGSSDNTEGSDFSGCSSVQEPPTVFECSGSNIGKKLESQCDRVIEPEGDSKMRTSSIENKAEAEDSTEGSSDTDF